MKILIAPWGNYKGWKEVTYDLENKKYKSTTSLKPVYETEKGKGQIDSVIIIASDTMAGSLQNRDVYYSEIKKIVQLR